MARTVMADFAGWPPTGLTLDFTEHQNLTSEIRARIESMPTNWSGTINEVLVVNSSPAGPVPISDGTRASFAHKDVFRFKNYRPVVTANDAITDDEHLGALILCENIINPITLTLAITGNSATGISDGFRCQILRAYDANTVTLSLTGMTNRHPAGDTKVQAARAIDVFLNGTDLYINGYSSP